MAGLQTFVTGRLGSGTVLSQRQIQILTEERALREHFGDDYERYCRQVSHWVGRGRRK
jgi:protein-S-isoprenylcysteine O-methyltransferase Ste14